MPDFPTTRRVNSLLISPGAPEALGNELNGLGATTASGTWPVANKAIFVPFEVFEPITIVKLFVENGTAVSGNIDVGIYDFKGTRLVSSGSTAQSGTSAIQEFDITDTLLLPGLYYLACVLDNTTGTLFRWSPSSSLCKALGVCEQTSAFPLPSTATFAMPTSALVPPLFATQRSVI